MLFSFRSSSRLVSTSAFAIAALTLLSCGGSGVGNQDGWAPVSPTGYFIRINTTTGTHQGASPGVVQFNFTSDHQAVVAASTVLTSTFLKTLLSTYIKTGKNDFSVSFDDKRNPTAPTTITAAFEATCIVDRQDENTKYILGRANWSYEGWVAGTVPPGTTEKGSGSNAEVEIGTF